MTLENVKIQQSAASFGDIVDVSSSDHVQLVCATGALLSFMERNKAVAQLEKDAASITVRRMELIQLEHYLFISPSTLKALQVFDTESHPGRSLGATGKEGFSVFGCLQETLSSVAGVGMLREWCLKPTRIPEVLKRRLDVVDFLQIPRFAEYITFLRKRLRQIKDIRKIYLHFRSATSSLSDWIGLCSTLTGMIKLLELVQLMVTNTSELPTPSLFQEILAEDFLRQPKDLVQVRFWLFSVEVCLLPCTTC